jgi:hypothetical protein
MFDLLAGGQLRGARHDCCRFQDFPGASRLACHPTGRSVISDNAGSILSKSTLAMPVGSRPAMSGPSRKSQPPRPSPKPRSWTTRRTGVLPEATSGSVNAAISTGSSQAACFAGVGNRRTMNEENPGKPYVPPTAERRSSERRPRAEATKPELDGLAEFRQRRPLVRAHRGQVLVVGLGFHCHASHSAVSESTKLTCQGGR